MTLPVQEQCVCFFSFRPACSFVPYCPCGTQAWTLLVRQWTVTKGKFFLALWYQLSKTQSQIFPLLFIWTLYAVVCLILRWILNKHSQRYQRSVPVHVHPYHAEVHLLQLCQGRQSLPCLSTEQSAHISQTNWTLGVKRAQAHYGLPSVSAP